MSLPGARLLGYATAPWSLKPLASGSMGEVAGLAPTSCGDVLRRISRLIVEDAVRGHERVPTGGQVEVPAGGQIEVPTLRVVS